MATGNSDFTRLITTTLQNHNDEIFDSVTTNNALTYYLKKKGNIKVVNGGRKFTHPIYYKKNSTFGAIDKLETIPTADQDNLTRAEYAIKVLAGSLAIPTFDIAANSGDKQKLLDLASFIKKDAEISMNQLLAEQVFKDGSSSKDFDGLAFLINSSPSTQTDVGGINPSTTGNEYWRNYIYNSGSAVSAFNTTNAGKIAMDTVLNEATFGVQGPRLIVTTKAIWQLYHLSLQDQVRYAPSDLRAGDGAFQTLMYATIPVVFDDNCTANTMYFVDTDQLWLQVLSKGNMAMTSFEQTHNQLSQIALMYTFANLTTGSRRTNGYIQITG